MNHIIYEWFNELKFSRKCFTWALQFGEFQQRIEIRRILRVLLINDLQVLVCPIWRRLRQCPF